MKNNTQIDATVVCEHKRQCAKGKLCEQTNPKKMKKIHKTLDKLKKKLQKKVGR